MQPLHQPAMADEVVEYLSCSEDKTILDMTVGMGGHTRRIIEKGAFVIGIDRDAESLTRAEANLQEYRGRFRLLHGRMSEAEDLLAGEGIQRVDGALIDAGVSMDQMLSDERGFSAHSAAQLDMRMDRSDPGSLTAYDVVNSYLEKDLLRIFAVISDRREARRVVRRIIRVREEEPIRTVAQLATLIAATIAKSRIPRQIDAAPYLMAIRMEVNDELDELQAAIEIATGLLTPTGPARIVTLTWNSAEHRVSRRTLRRLANPCTCPPALPCSCGKLPSVRLLTPKLLFPSEEEVARNPASRSVRLNAAERI